MNLLTKHKETHRVREWTYGCQGEGWEEEIVREFGMDICTVLYLFLYLFIYFNWRLITLQYCSSFCHTLTWISHGCTCVPHPEPPLISLPIPSLWVIPVHRLSLPCFMHWTWTGDLFHTCISYMFQCCSVKSSHPHLLPQNPKVCSLYLSLLLSRI